MLTHELSDFIGLSQKWAITHALQGEEGQHFVELTREWSRTIQTMPKTYETDGQGKNSVAYLHYFRGGMDWYITEKDMENEQLQAFGLVDMGYGPELGYINIEELKSSNVELDLYWTPKPLKSIGEC
jgi:hypothetical protein